MKAHDWQPVIPSEKLGLIGYVCRGCNGVTRGQELPPLDACPGKGPYTPEDAAVIVAAFEAVGFDLPKDFWERTGPAALKRLLDEGAKAG